MQTPVYYEYYHIMKIYKFKLFDTDFNLKWFSGISTIVLSYACHQNFFFIRAEMRSKTRRRVTKVVTYAVAVEAALYIIISVAGYISLGKTLTPGVFTLRAPLRKLRSSNLKPGKTTF